MTTSLCGDLPARPAHHVYRTAVPAPDVTYPGDHRAAVLQWWAGRRDARMVHLWRDDDGTWRVMVTDGMGRRAGPALPALPDEQAARRVARRAWELLRA